MYTDYFQGEPMIRRVVAAVLLGLFVAAGAAAPATVHDVKPVKDTATAHDIRPRRPPFTTSDPRRATTMTTIEPRSPQSPTGAPLISARRSP
jgi:hypothetical protein